MADYVVENHRYCRSVDDAHYHVEGSKGDIYEITFARHRRANNQEIHGWECTCPDFKIRRAKKNQKCKHIRQIEETKHCGWFSFIDGGSALGPFQDCPRCGGPTRPVEIGL